MRNKLRLATLLGLAAVLVTGLVLVGVYRALVHEPSFYRRALETTDDDLHRGSDELLENAAALFSNARAEGEWHALFTGEQINGWLAVDLPKNHRNLLPREFRDPRVLIERDRVAIACRYDAGPVPLVVSMQFDLYLAGPNQAALRIRSARAGALPLPLKQILDGISTAARDMDLRVQWYQEQGAPLALISFPPPRGENGTLLRVETLDLHDGELYVAGCTERDGTHSSEPQRETPPEVATQPAENENRQR